jgi:dienelactone hydrolase
MNVCPESSTPGPGGGSLPPISDYGAAGPFATTIVENTGPDGNYTIYRPATLGDNGFRHPIATWGNGIVTDPSWYPELLGTIASHGFVVVASNSSTVDSDLMTAGLDWLIAQNNTAGVFQGKLDPARAVSIGYSLGGGAAVDTGSHPNVIATVSFHGLQGGAEWLHGPLLLFTGTEDWFVSADAFVTPTYERSSVQTFYATLTGADHLYPLGDAGDERAPAIAWLRLWVYGDQGARAYFYGDNCKLCQSPWVNVQRKNWR